MTSLWHGLRDTYYATSTEAQLLEGKDLEVEGMKSWMHAWRVLKNIVSVSHLKFQLLYKSFFWKLHYNVYFIKLDEAKEYIMMKKILKKRVTWVI